MDKHLFRTIAFAALACVAVAGIAAASVSAAGTAAGPSAISPAGTQHAFLTAVSFADASDGWVAGHSGSHGYVFRTRNGGRSWTRISTHWTVSQMQFISPSEGWAIVQSPVGCGGSHCQQAVVYTRNGGASWSLQLNGGSCWTLQSLDFITSQEGWVIANNSPCVHGSHKITTRIVMTGNGGQSWHTQFQPGPRLTSVHFGSPGNGWAVADGLTGGNSAHCKTILYAKSTMSQTWAAQQLTVSGYCSGYVDFVNARSGWMLVSNVGACAMGGCYDNRLYRTTNGGTSWSIEQKRWNGGACGFLQTPHFVNDSTGYIPVSQGAGSCSTGGLIITHDGGVHWTRKSPRGFQIADLSPVTASNVWAIGCARNRSDCSHLVHTTNAGYSWSQSRVD